MENTKLTGGHILVIEDQDDFRESLVEMLELERYRAEGARNGAEALSALAQGALPALILLDLIMPGMDGWEFRACQVANPAFASVPIVVITGAERATEDLLILQAVGCLTKPIDWDRLLGIVARYCRPAGGPVP